ncbi:MAG: hypothetical protein L0Y50_09565 [Beijerinckiaceae bacterium]|nr:hypothetical protein [Beijerinckiaceae bacterium]MCI0736500.1 hypothetical protein [Beijerinckiaceae bacterium]
MKSHLRQTTAALLLMAEIVPFAKAAESARSFPPDTNNYVRPAVPDDADPLKSRSKAPAPLQPGVTSFVVDTVVNNTNPNLRNTDTFNDGETSIAIDPNNTSRIVITAFSGSWGATAPLWLSTNGGQTWTKRFTINPPPGVTGVLGCPCDQTVDFARLGFNAPSGSPIGGLAGTFLLGNGNVYSANSANLTSPIGAFDYFTVGGVAQATNHLNGVGEEDQPWLLAGTRSVGNTVVENIYVGYDDFHTAPDMRVAVARATDPLNFTIDTRSGFSGPGFVNPANPGHRLAVDPRSGAVYSLFQRPKMAGAGGSQNIDYMLNRSTDGGNTWTLNGSATGIVVANADSTQAQPKFCTVNALLGGVDHATVDPKTGDVVYVYGSRNPITGHNRLAMRRLTPNAAGGLTIGPQRFITGFVQAAIPAVAITKNRTIGVFYYTCDGFSAAGFPIFTAHFRISSDLGATFTDHILETFLSPAMDNGDPRQRVLGDYMQVKSVGNTFFGAFTGNGVPFGRPFSNNDPIFFKIAVGLNTGR